MTRLYRGNVCNKLRPAALVSFSSSLRSRTPSLTSRQLIREGGINDAMNQGLLDRISLHDTGDKAGAKSIPSTNGVDDFHIKAWIERNDFLYCHIDSFGIISNYHDTGATSGNFVEKSFQTRTDAVIGNMASQKFW